MNKQVIIALIIFVLPIYVLAEPISRDCSYSSPPKERTAVVLSFDCETTTHNVKVLESGQDYFIPKSTANDNPPFCLVRGPANRNTVEVAKERQRMYCRNSQKRGGSSMMPKIDTPPPQ